MATAGEGDRLPIGEVLKRTRSRRKLDIRAVEQQTKIRIKYLRALENEEWEVLPGPAYARGFLRTYAAFLGLDADALVDEYNRTAESPDGADQQFTLGEPLLAGRRRPGDESRGRWGVTVPVILALAAAAIAILVILGLTGESGNKGSHHHKGKAAAHHHSQGGRSGGDPSASESQPVTLALVTRDDMEICLVTGDGRALIDSQTLVSGAKEGPFQPPADNYRLDLDSGGAATVTLDGTPHPVRSRAPASFKIDSHGVEPTAFKGPTCP